MDNKLISYILLTYNSELYVKEAINSALLQDYHDLEIIISDDCSTDNTVKIVSDLLSRYDGDHKIIFNRNETNMGIAGNFQQAVNLSHGSWIVAAAGDDISHQRRVSIVSDAVENNVYAIWSSYTHDQTVLSQTQSVYDAKIYNINSYDTIKKSIEELVATGATAAWHRSLFDVGFPKGLMCEDNLLTFRALLKGNIKKISLPLVYYRTHESSYTNFNKTDVSKEWQLRMRLACQHLMLYKKCLQEIGDISNDPELRYYFLKSTMRLRVKILFKIGIKFLPQVFGPRIYSIYLKIKRYGKSLCIS